MSDEVSENQDKYCIPLEKYANNDYGGRLNFYKRNFGPPLARAWDRPGLQGQCYIVCGALTREEALREFDSYRVKHNGDPDVKSVMPISHFGTFEEESPFRMEDEE